MYLVASVTLLYYNVDYICCKIGHSSTVTVRAEEVIDFHDNSPYIIYMAEYA